MKKVQPQNNLQNLTTALNYLNFQIGGAVANMRHFSSKLDRHPAYQELQDCDTREIVRILYKIDAIVEELKTLRQDIKEINKRKARKPVEVSPS